MVLSLTQLAFKKTILISHNGKERARIFIQQLFSVLTANIILKLRLLLKSSSGVNEVELSVVNNNL